MTVETFEVVVVGVASTGLIILVKERMNMHATQNVKIINAMMHPFRFIANVPYTNDR